MRVSWTFWNTLHIRAADIDRCGPFTSAKALTRALVSVAAVSMAALPPCPEIGSIWYSGGVVSYLVSYKGSAWKVDLLLPYLVRGISDGHDSTKVPFLECILW